MGRHIYICRGAIIEDDVMQVKVTDDDHDYTITPSKNRYYFDNTDETERLEAGDDEDGVDFEALRRSRIRGAVKDADDNGMGGVTVTATARDRTPAYAPSEETKQQRSLHHLG